MFNTSYFLQVVKKAQSENKVETPPEGSDTPSKADKTTTTTTSNIVADVGIKSDDGNFDIIVDF